MDEKKFKVGAPVGNITVPKPVMTSKELREFALQLIQEPDNSEVWEEKIKKDEIGLVVEWLENLGYTIDEI